jgi:hypothetical protein
MASDLHELLIALFVIIGDAFIPFRLAVRYLFDILFGLMVLFDSPIPGNLIYCLFAAIASPNHTESDQSQYKSHGKAMPIACFMIRDLLKWWFLSRMNAENPAIIHIILSVRLLEFFRYPSVGE